MTFEEYLISKKIDGLAFSQGEPMLFEEWRLEFDQQHPKSFTAQKLFLINNIRRRFLLKVETATPENNPEKPVVAASPAKPKPIMRPKIN